MVRKVYKGVLHSVTMVKSIIIRMNLNTLARIKKAYKPFPKESVASYFSRLAKFLELSEGGLK